MFFKNFKHYREYIKYVNTSNTIKKTKIGQILDITNNNIIYSFYWINLFQI